MPYGNNNGGYQNNYRKGGTGGSRYGAARSTDDYVSSTGMSFANEAVGKFMSFNYWGRNVSLEIATCPPGVPMTWELRKNAQVFRQVISFTSIADLNAICEEVLDSIKANGSFTPVGIRVGSKKDSIVEISNGENIKMPAGIYLVVYKGLDNTNRTNLMEFYPFDNTKFVRGYDHTTGNMREDISKVGEFKKFARAISNAMDAFTMAQAHAISELKKNDKMASFKALAAIGAALGVDMTKDLLEKKTTGSSSYTRNQNPTSGGSGGYRSGSYGGNRQGGGNYQRGSYNAPRTSTQQSTFEQPAAPTGYQAALANMSDEPVDINLDVSQLQNVSLSDFANG